MSGDHPKAILGPTLELSIPIVVFSGLLFLIFLVDRYYLQTSQVWLHSVLCCPCEKLGFLQTKRSSVIILSVLTLVVEGFVIVAQTFGQVGPWSIPIGYIQLGVSICAVLFAIFMLIPAYFLLNEGDFSAAQSFKVASKFQIILFYLALILTASAVLDVKKVYTHGEDLGITFDLKG